MEKTIEKEIARLKLNLKNSELFLDKFKQNDVNKIALQYLENMNSVIEDLMK